MLIKNITLYTIIKTRYTFLSKSFNNLAILFEDFGVQTFRQVNAHIKVYKLTFFRECCEFLLRCIFFVLNY